jgi:hypothetical protein
VICKFLDLLCQSYFGFSKKTKLANLATAHMKSHSINQNVENKPKSTFIQSQLCQDMQFASGFPAAAQSNLEMNKDQCKNVSLLADLLITLFSE